ncbi:hypothetical protein K490DRAFT_74324 [Saccharata proteae CBS 121410]|uniref:Cytochrome oxidase c assembly-domain-containing protein n=1 Tax=Saccharata proteae CBS 121410 TaxID=1314787 RepID=A0A9P4LUP6_9PEZI|nr:hypothetical protein K490DRAFT_74324 [Saccharata proteae CBS 121410]
MPRSASDATRFTATGPYATSKASTVPLNAASPRRPNETPQEKVARLRAAAQQAKKGKESTFDKVVARGRVWADRAHKVTALSLIAATGIAGVVTVFALGDMVMYNRRKRKEWFIEQTEKHAKLLEAAREAAARGAADDDQILLLNRERAAEESQQAAAEKPGIFKSIKKSIFGELPMEEQKGGKLGAIGKEASEQAQWGVETARETAHDVKEEGLGILKAVEEKRRDGERAIPHVSGGPLDNLGEDAASAAAQKAAAAAQKSKSWTDWALRR